MCGARAALTFRSSSLSPVQPGPASAGVLAFLHRGGRSIRAQARSRSSAHRLTPLRTPRGRATQCLGSWRGKRAGSAAPCSRRASRRRLIHPSIRGVLAPADVSTIRAASASERSRLWRSSFSMLASRPRQSGEGFRVGLPICPTACCPGPRLFQNDACAS